MAHSAPDVTAAHGRQTHYSVPQPMPWPIMGSASLFMMALGAVLVFNDARAGWAPIAAGFALLLYMMVRWFGEVISESESGRYGRWEDVSFRWGMSFFIFSEVMFFGAFFGALFWARTRDAREPGAGLAGVHPALAFSRPGVPRAVHADGRLGASRGEHDPAA